LKSEKAEYSAILFIIHFGFAADYRAGRCRKANIAPSLFDWPTSKRADRNGLPHDMTIFIKDELYNRLCRP
jgi:hypothetical protein